MNRPNDPVVRPVIWKTGPAYKTLPVRERVRYLSRLARKALVISARHQGVNAAPSDFLKDDQGAPLPVAGIFWSLSHKPAYVAAVAAPRPVGIDVERITPRPEGLWDKVTAPEERALLPDRSPTAFFRCWTAKEAVLKSASVGLAHLSGCRIVSVPDDRRLILAYDNNVREVIHFFHDDHLFSMVTRQQWTVYWELATETETG